MSIDESQVRGYVRTINNINNELKKYTIATKSLRPMPLGATLTRFRLLAIANLLDHLG